MDWREEGTVLTVRRHGETSVILEVFTARHGRHAGVVRGGASRRMAPHLQPGAVLDLTWRARLDAHLGSFAAEPLRARADLMSDRRTLAALNAITALLSFGLPEREPHPQLYDITTALLDLLGSEEHWPRAYLAWELALLDALGFGLDLSSCPLTGATEGLAYVSPRSGRAVSADGAGAWADRLLPLPPALLGGAVGRGDMARALETTGHFLDRLAASLGDRPLPSARTRLVELLTRD